MITPKFSCSQDDSSVTIKLYVPSVRASEVEVHVDGTIFSLHINPYFLKLNFSHPVTEDDDSKAQYDPSSGYLTIKLTKEEKGQSFDDLDLLAKLLAPPAPVEDSEDPLIEVIGGDSDDEEEEGGGDDDGSIKVLVGATERLDLENDELQEERRVFLEAEASGWHYPQEPEPDVELVTSARRPYGFLDAYSGYFKHVGHTANEVNELGVDAENVSPAERKKSREQHEKEKWDEEYYIADFVNDEEIQELIKWKTPYASTDPIEFTDEEKESMMRLPRKEYLINQPQSRTLYLTLISILFAYAYDLRTTTADPTPESAWTLASLTPAFSALDVSFTSSLTATIHASYRRALAFPLYRNWAFCERCRVDVVDILRNGRRGVTRALLQTKKILDRHDTYYVYSKIWVNDFVVWAQSYASEKAFQDLATKVEEAAPKKSDIGWSLEELEAATEGLEPDSDDED